MNFLNRVGTFFLILAGTLLMLFIFSDIARSPQFTFLVFGGIVLLAGIIMKITNPIQKPPSQAQRFRVLKRKQKNKPSDDTGDRPSS